MGGFSWAEEERSEHERRVEAAREAGRTEKEKGVLADLYQQTYWVETMVSLLAALLVIGTLTLVAWSEGVLEGVWEGLKFLVESVYYALSGGF